MNLMRPQHAPVQSTLKYVIHQIVTESQFLRQCLRLKVQCVEQALLYSV